MYYCQLIQSSDDPSEEDGVSKLQPNPRTRYVIHMYCCYGDYSLIKLRGVCTCAGIDDIDTFVSNYCEVKIYVQMCNCPQDS